jgi:thiol-disulfide isomerase/thioredoxin
VKVEILGLVFTVFVGGCAGSNSVQQTQDPVGRITREQLSPAFITAYDTIHIQTEFVDMIRQANTGVDVLVFLGTWCGDSKREVPRFLRVVDAAGIPMDRITLHALDRKKTSPDGTEVRYRIERVPTFIFLKKETEIGRIVETPKTTLEGDILTILAAAVQR